MEGFTKYALISLLNMCRGRELTEVCITSANHLKDTLMALGGVDVLLAILQIPYS